MSHIAHVSLFFVFTFLPIKLEIARSEMYHYRICVHRGAGLEGGGDLSATDTGLWGNKACMRSCFPPLNGVSMSPGPSVACGLSEVVDLAWPSCIISLLNHVGCVSRWLTSSAFTDTCSSLSPTHTHTIDDVTHDESLSESNPPPPQRSGLNSFVATDLCVITKLWRGGAWFIFQAIFCSFKNVLACVSTSDT